MSDATGTARITLLPADAPPQLATAPVVAFVHPQEDATLDVFAAVVEPDAARAAAQRRRRDARTTGHRSRSTRVGQNHLRVSGTTATGASGTPGHRVVHRQRRHRRPGRAACEGEATVYLLPPAPELAPIAVDDTVVVRAGVADRHPGPRQRHRAGRAVARRSIPRRSCRRAPTRSRSRPATCCATSPRPSRASTRSSTRVFTTGAPVARRHRDRARAGARRRREPRPAARDARGSRAERPVDHRRVRRLRHGPRRRRGHASTGSSSQPEQRLGDDLGRWRRRSLYTSVAGLPRSGVVPLPRRRRVRRDGRGHRAHRRPRRRVQPESDHLHRLRAGAGGRRQHRSASARSRTTSTRRMGTLAITDVRPDLPATLTSTAARTPSTTRLDGRIRPSDDATVVIEAGTEPATMSFLYDVESTSGNTGRGLIVVKVVRESVPDYPVVADTVLTAENRDDFPRGVDVLTGKVTWSGGDVDDLSVGLWGDPPGVRSTATNCAARCPRRTPHHPVRRDRGGTDGPVTTYAFLRVPGDDDLSLALRSGAASPRSPNSNRSRSTWPTSSQAARERARGRRRRARLRRADRGRVRGRIRHPVRYDAGAGAPWVDACQVPVRIAGQDDWTYLSVPIIVHRARSAAELRAGSMTVGPGETATFDLRNMTSVAAARGLERHPLRPGVLRLGLRRLARRVDRHGHRRRPAVPGVGGGRDRLGDEPRRRRAGPTHPARRRRAIDASAGRLGRRSSARRRPGRRAPIAVIGARGRGEPAAADPARGRRRARRPARASG